MASIELSQQGPIVAVPAGPAAEAQPKRIPFEFSGSGGEYFRIWIVNILLSIVTLGIYSAWAKVRNKQYFYGSTTLQGASFEYTANPVSILKGRILVVFVLVLYQLVTVFAPILAAIMALGLVFLFPWVVVQALKFNARYSSFRNLRFHFGGGYGESFRYYILWTIFSVFSLGLAYPYAIYLRKGFTINRSRYGDTSFEFSGRARYFYVVYLLAVLVVFGLVVGVSVLFGGLVAITGLFGGSETAGDPERVRVAIYFGLAINMAMFAVFLGVAVVVQTVITNHVLSHTRLGPVQLDMRMDPFKVLWIQLSNVIAIVLSIGMLIPWAKVRIVRYRLSCLSLFASEPLDGFVASERGKITATGDEMGEALDLDLGL